MLSKCNADQHISWIKGLQQPDGSFKGPWSKRSTWEDTFYAVKSLNIFGSSLAPEKAQLCQNYCSSLLVDKGIERNRPDIIYHCFGALKALGAIDDGISELTSNRLSSKIEEVLLTNIALNYEDVHFIVMTYHLLNEHIRILAEPLKLLTERIKAALEAELADI